MDDQIHLRMLGSVQLTRNGEALKGIRTHKALALLCYLAQREQTMTRSHLADLLWRDKSESRGRANLSLTLHNLTSLLPGCFQAARDTIQMLPGPWLEIDTTHFNTLLSQGDIASLKVASELYSGEFMSGFTADAGPEFDTWLVMERELWQQRIAQVLYTLIGHYRSQGHNREAMQLASRLLALDPWREEAHRQMMLLLALNGQRAAALAQYESCRRILQTELGVEPCAETEALHQRLLAGQRGSQIAAGLHPAAGFSISPSPADHNHAAHHREHTVAQIIERMDEPTCRLLTLTGAASPGRTQVARLVAHHRLSQFTHGVHFVNALHIDSADSLVLAVAGAFMLSLPYGAGQRKQLLNFLRDKEALLVIDHVENSREVSGVIEDIMKRAPRVKILVTSQYPVNLWGEWIFDL